MKEKSKENLETMIKTDETKIIARDDEVKAIKTNAEEFRARKDKQIDERIETESLITLPSPFATTFNIFILTFTILIFSSNIFNFNPFVSTHHVQTFTIGDFSDYKVLHLSRLINSAHTKATTKALANTDSIRLFKVPESNLIHALETYTGTSLFQDTYSQVRSGNLKTIFTTTHS